MVENTLCVISMLAGICVIGYFITLSIENVSKEWRREEQRKYDEILNQKTKKEDT